MLRLSLPFSPPRSLRRCTHLAAGMMLLTTIGCGGGGDSGGGTVTPPTPTVQSVAVTPSAATLTSAGQTTTLSAEVQLSNGSVGSQTLTWTSSNLSVATVSSGVVTAVSSGQATITATAAGISGQAAITVAIPTVQTITVSPATATLTAAGQTAPLTAEIRLSNGAVGTGTLTWASTNPAVATVTAAGLVTAVASGATSITATLGSVVGQAAITVAIPTVQSIVMTPTTASITALGATTRITAEVRLSNGAVGTQTPVWTSSNPAVATVSSGTVTAVSNGTATISAAVGMVTGTAAITVAQAVASVRLLPLDTVMKTSGPIRAAALDARGNVIANAPLQWAAVNPGIATVSSAGVVTPLTAGVSRMRVTSGDFTTTSIVRSIANIRSLSDMLPLFEFSATSRQRRVLTDVSQSSADSRAALAGQVWSYMETVLQTSGSPTTDLYFTTWPEIWLEATPFCGGTLFPNQDIYQSCATPNRSHWIVPTASDFTHTTRWLSRQFLLASMPRVIDFPWFLGAYPLWLAGGSFQSSTIVGAPLRALINDFRTGDAQNLLVPLDTLMRTDNVRYFENLPQRTPVAVRQAQATLFVAYLNRDFPTVLPAILARIRATAGNGFTNDLLMEEITTRTGRTIQQLNASYLEFARALQP